MSRVSQKYWFRQIFICFQNYQNQGQSTEGKEKTEEDRNDDKKMKQIRIFCINCIQFIKFKIQNNELLKKLFMYLVEGRDRLF